MQPDPRTGFLSPVMGQKVGSACLAGLQIDDLRNDLAGPFCLHVAASSLVVISGASGTGKSLFLRMVADLDPNTGQVSLAGQERAGFDGPSWRRQAPYLAAESGWWCNDVVDHFLPADQDEARRLAERVGVGTTQFAGPVDRLSTGERQRLALVRTLVLRSPVLLLDEPTGPLDPVSVGKVEALIRERTDIGTIVLMVSHDPEQAIRLNAERYVMIDRQLRKLA